MTVTSAVLENVMPAVTGAVMFDRVQVDPCPAQAPLQLTKVEPPLAAAVRVTVSLVLMTDELVHVPDAVPAVEVQLMPPILLVTVPVPLPPPVTVTVVALNKAVTAMLEPIVTVQGTVVPLQAPPQPANAVPTGAVGVKLTDLPCTNDALQPAPPVELQLLIPVGELLTVAALGPVAVTARVKVGNSAKLAVTVEVDVPTVKLQLAVPEHGPLHPAKDDVVVSGAAVKVTVEPADSVALVQVAEVAPDTTLHAKPVPLTEPLPAPAPATVTVVRLNVALTLEAEVPIVTEHAPVPVQALPQPAKTDPPGTLPKLRLTLLPWAKDALQAPVSVPPVEVQLIPAGVLVTVPVPAPRPVIDSVEVGAGANTAFTVTGEVPSVNTQEPVPVHGPVQPENTDAFEDGAAVNVTVAPLAIAVEFVHVPDVVPVAETLQLIPPSPVTVPAPVLPVPDTVTVVAVNVALTDCAEDMGTEQLPVPLQAPPHAVNAEPVEALGVNTTSVPCKKEAVHVPGQLIPDGLLVTEPSPEVVTVRANCGVKLAETETGVLPIVSTQAPVPLHASPHVAKTELAPGAADIVTVDPSGNVAVHVPGQVIPAGELVMVPDPVVAAVTVIRGTGEKVAITLAGAEPMEKLQVPVPEHAPPHPANTDPAAGVALSETAPLVLIGALVHVPDVVPDVEVQLTPPVPETVPVPVPAPATVTGNDVGIKSAVTDCADDIVTTQEPVPEHAPPQPLKADALEVGVAVSVTEVPLSKFAVQLAPQVMPAGELDTDPEPVPVVLTANAYCVIAGAKVAVTA